MQILSDAEVYEEVAPWFQTVLIDALNRALQENGIQERERRRSICDQFIFEASELLDEGWVKHKNGKKAFPRVCFVDRRLEEDEDADAKAKVYLPAGGFEFHSYSHGSVAYYFDDCNEKLKEVKTGG